MVSVANQATIEKTGTSQIGPPQQVVRVAESYTWDLPQSVFREDSFLYHGILSASHDEFHIVRDR